jgi:heme/copper-type cytochrome/quinol oxidase subunit 1
MAEITLHSHNSKAIGLMTIVSIFLVFAIVAVALRIRARLRLNQKFYLNDYAIFFALVANPVNSDRSSYAEVN